MKNKNEKIKGNPLKKSSKSHTINFCRGKISLFQNMITKTILAVQKYKIMDIISASDINICIQNLESLYRELNRLRLIISNRKNFDDIINDLQKINVAMEELPEPSQPFFSWLEKITSEEKGKSFFDWLLN